MSVKIFGVANPKIAFPDLTVDYSASGLATDVVVNTKYKLLDPVRKVHESALTGRRHLIHKGNYAEFTLDVINAGRAGFDFQQHLADILDAGVGQTVTFYPNTDSNQAFECLVIEVVPYYVQNDFVEDAYRIVLMSIGYVAINTADDLPETYAYWVDETGSRIVDEAGNHIVLRQNSYEPPNG
ncbi:MAG: hypothetical protein K8R90_05130 [Candidatus Cloacimonetes bacterium]|nr:hypothetical protein [Candidatus Cloacimonadota bacterium]